MLVIQKVGPFLCAADIIEVKWEACEQSKPMAKRRLYFWQGIRWNVPSMVSPMHYVKDLQPDALDFTV